MSVNTTKNEQAFTRLVNIMNDLREKCPWDRKQTIESLRILTIEECYELAEEISKGDFNGIREEVGDLLLHMVFYAKIASEQGAWDIADALNGICEKLIRRHPHIYGDITLDNAEDVISNWEKIKLKEGKKSILQGVPSGLPALVKAYRIQEKVGNVGFEWEKIEDVWAKVEEERIELQEAVAGGNIERITDEFGDLLFALVNYSRFLKIDPEMALEKTNQKFRRRFEYVEKCAGDKIHEMTLEDLDAFWEEAKKSEKR